MRDQTFYMLDNDELTRIYDLCEGLSLAVGKIIRGRRLIRDYNPPHPAIEGFDHMVKDILLDKEEKALDELF